MIPKDFVASFPEIIALQLEYSNDETFQSQFLSDDIEALGCGQFLSFLVALEKKVGDLSSLRPYSRALKVKHEWKLDVDTDTDTVRLEGFVWLVRLNDVLPNAD